MKQPHLSPKDLLDLLVGLLATWAPTVASPRKNGGLDMKQKLIGTNLKTVR